MNTEFDKVIKAVFENEPADEDMLSLGLVARGEKGQRVSCSTTYVKGECFERDIIVMKTLADILPHGSGINADWHVKQMKRKTWRWTAINAYHAMDEAGGYCHYYPIEVTIDAEWHPDEDGAEVKIRIVDVYVYGRERNCCGFGLKEYIDNTVYYSLTGADTIKL